MENQETITLTRSQLLQIIKDTYRDGTLYEPDFNGASLMAIELYANQKLIDLTYLINKLENKNAINT